jgi:hypothetical protein
MLFASLSPAFITPPMLFALSATSAPPRWCRADLPRCRLPLRRRRAAAAAFLAFRRYAMPFSLMADIIISLIRHCRFTPLFSPLRH